ncbi:uncharacterized protein LAESUDRAFT_746145 [Laetiporus sulphureus 93-53]|uniref:Uncharacterized protein n=1 Tax=Laetiporus sulphureus 93-53 TaxID=1314785 RepID=A0A165I4V2_9APHY|nr:uncharacterized protein LAESUDRAFT_746145 [Laetiporus sulphureus 93-53]KZT12596.1 hypothetical protein LAESUDRAFT_746145 [Laetiporus sulphureus 93-53]
MSTISNSAERVKQDATRVGPRSISSLPASTSTPRQRPASPSRPLPLTMSEEFTDILGGKLNIAPELPSSWSRRFLTVFLLPLLFILFIWLIALPYYRDWKEEHHRKAVRRRFGIPDHDTRAFVVAHAAVKAAKEEKLKAERREKEAQANGNEEKKQREATGSMIASQAGDHAPQQSEDVRGTSRIARAAATPPPARPKGILITPPSPGVTHFPGDFDGPSSQPADVSPEPSVRIHRPGQIPPKSPFPPALKRPRDENGQNDTDRGTKKGRANGKRRVSFEDEMQIVEISLQKRGSKRVADAEDDASIEATRASDRDKRARKGSLEVVIEQSDEEMDIEEDRDTNLSRQAQPASRGKKRDRSEAGSTLDREGSFGDDEDDGEQKVRRHRKKRATAQKEPGSRGQKRGREAEESESEEESDSPKRRDTRKKRGKTDFEDEISSDPLCKGRRIGEEWDANGVRYKVGPNGQRLRQALLKRSRSRFPMPKDSQHPDRAANVDILVEKWLSEEEYQAAKERRELAWQEEDVHGDVEDFMKAGKTILYAPAAAHGAASIVAGLGIHVNPFQRSQFGVTRRVAPIVNPALPAAPDAPKPRPVRSYSKWEKQDLEAAAMSRIREKAAAAEEARKAAATRSSQASIVTTVSFAPAATQPSNNVPATSNMFSTPPTSGPSTTTSNVLSASSVAAPAATKPASPAPSAPTLAFSFPSSIPTTSQMGPPSLIPTRSSGSVESQPAASASTGTAQGAQPSAQMQTSGTAPAPTFSWTKPQGATTLAPPAVFQQPASSASSFNAQQAGMNAEPAAPSGTPSLLSRLGPQVSSAPAQPAGPSSGMPTFTFTPPSAPPSSSTANTSSFQTAPFSATNTSSAAAPAPATAAQAPSFSFNFPQPSHAATPAITMSRATPPDDVMNVEPAKPADSMFVFGAPTQTAPNPPSTFTFAPSTPVKPSSVSFANVSTPQSSTTPTSNPFSTTPKVPPPQSVYGGFGSGGRALTAAPSGNAVPSSQPMVQQNVPQFAFSQPAPQPTFSQPAPQSTLGGNASAPAAQQGTVSFNFGPTSVPGAGSSMEGQQSTSQFTFGSGKGTTTPVPSAPSQSQQPLFHFGASAPSANATVKPGFGTQQPASTNAFGGQPAAFSSGFSAQPNAPTPVANQAAGGFGSQPLFGGQATNPNPQPAPSAPMTANTNASTHQFGAAAPPIFIFGKQN